MSEVRHRGQSGRMVVVWEQEERVLLEFETNRISWSAQCLVCQPKSGSLYMVSVGFSKSLFLLSSCHHHLIVAICLPSHHHGSTTSSWTIESRFTKRWDSGTIHLTHTTMPPLINWYPRHYHPFSRPLALHSSFPAERHTCPPHLLFTIYPTDPDITAIDHPEPLMHKLAVVTATNSFAIIFTCDFE